MPDEVSFAIEFANESRGFAYASKAHCANLFEWLARLMVSCTQFPGNLIPSEIDLILPADQSGSRLELEIHASKRFF